MRLLISILLLFCFCNVFPLDQQYKFRHLTTKDGLPSNDIRAIIKDSQGFMWFATSDGLTRYDGYGCKTFKLIHDTISSKSNMSIRTIFEDKEGNLWVSTYRDGLKIFDRITESFMEVEQDFYDPNSSRLNYVVKIFQDNEGVLWFGSNGEGLLKYDAKTKSFKSFIQKGHFKNNVNEIYEDNSDTLWIGTDDGVYLFDRDKESFHPIPLNEQLPTGIYVTSIIQDRKGKLWVGTTIGLFKYDLISQQFKHYTNKFKEEHRKSSNFLSGKGINSIVEEQNPDHNVLWIATRFGLNRFDTDKEVISYFFKDANNPQSISNSQLNHICQDQSGMLWIGTLTSGVEVLNTRSNTFHHVKMRPSGKNNLYDNQAACFLLDSEQTLWVGSYDYGIYHYDKNLTYIDKPGIMPYGLENLHSTEKSKVDCIYEDSKNTIWIGFNFGSLVNVTQGENTFNLVDFHIETDPYTYANMHCFFEDQSGILWIGNKMGLFYKDLNNNEGDSPQAIDHESLRISEIYNIIENRKNNVWISSSTGLYCLPPENRKPIEFVSYKDILPEQIPNSKNNELIISIYEDNSGILWLGSNKGLYKFDIENRRLIPINNVNNNYEGYFAEIYGDKHNNLWIFHETNGLVRYNTVTNSIKVYDKKDGLPYDNFTSTYSFHSKFYQSPDGRLFMGGDVGTGDGFFWFHPDSIKDNTKIPPVCLTEFQLGGEEFSLDSIVANKKHITLKHDQNFFSLEFAALDYTIPDKNQYAYFLEGYEDDWIYSENRRLANYTGVPPGHYTFRVKGSNNDGYWNEEGTYVNITILPPFWKTWWAYIIYGLLIISILYSIIHFYLRRQRLLHNLESEQVESEKLKELDTLKTKFYTNISHEFRTPLTLILGPAQRLQSKIKNPAHKQELSMVQKNARRLKEMVDQLLSLSKLESGKMKLNASEVDLIEFIRTYLQSFESLADHKKVKLLFDSDQKPIPVFIDKGKFVQVINNILTNAFKFTEPGGEIRVKVAASTISNEELQAGDEHVEIEISDTGSGIPPEKLERIFERFYQVDDSITREKEGTGIGLAIAKEMVSLHHGRIDVKSTPGEGTTFFIYLPLGKAHLKTDEILIPDDSDGKIEDANISEDDLSLMDEGKVKEIPQDQNGEDETHPILLIVEDNSDMRSFIRGYFEEDYKIIESEDGEDGIVKAVEHIPDIIISDVMMPKMDGYQFCEKIKTDERTSHIPVILLTALASKESRVEGLETGADDFITKPFDGEELMIRVKNLIEQRKKLSEYYRKDFDIIQESSRERTLSMEEKFLQKATSTMENNLYNSYYGVEEFASDMALSRYQLHRKLRALVSQSTTEFIRLIRLNHSIRLLEDNAGTISEIAYKSGFNNPIYFSLSFKKQFGMSPTEYLNQVDS